MLRGDISWISDINDTQKRNENLKYFYASRLSPQTWRLFATSACIRAVLQLLRSRARNTRSAWTEEPWRRIARVKARTVSHRCGIAVRIAAFALVDSSRRANDKSVWILRSTYSQNNVSSSTQTTRKAGLRGQNLCRCLQNYKQLRCEMKKRVSLNDRPIAVNRHVLYIGHEIRHACVENVLK